MSGFDTSQPIADDKSLEDGDIDADVAAKVPSEDDVDAEELGDATPGPR